MYQLTVFTPIILFRLILSVFLGTYVQSHHTTSDSE